MDEMQLLLGAGGGMPALLVVAVDGAARGEHGIPCRIVGRLSSLTAPAPAAPPSGSSDVITQLLGRIGVPPNLLGYSYLRTALQVMCASSACPGLMNGVYPQVGTQYGVSGRSVERAIRHAICQTWARSGGEGYRRALGRLGSPTGDRPTNGEFLSQLLEVLRLQGA